MATKQEEISVVRRDDFSVQFTLTVPGSNPKVPIDMSTYSFILTVRKTPTSASATITLTGAGTAPENYNDFSFKSDDPTLGVMNANFARADTNITAGVYVYDLQLYNISSDKVTTPVNNQNLVIAQDITQSAP